MAREQLRRARASGDPDFITTPTVVESTGLVIPPIRSETDSRRWRLQEPWTWSSEGWTLRIDEGWTTDLADVPPRFRRWLNSFQFGITGPLVHDFIYEHKGRPPTGGCDPWREFSRLDADRIFLKLMKSEGVPRWRRMVGFLGVRAWGRPHFRDRFPEAPRPTPRTMQSEKGEG